MDKIVQVKQYIAAPVIEEILYRGFILNFFLNSEKYTTKQSILISPLFFSLSHLHHIIKARNEDSKIFQREVGRRIFQVWFTWIFGAYAGFIYVSSGKHLIAPILLHSYCNIIQVPSIGIWFREETEPILRKIIGGGYLIGIAIFYFISIQL